MDIGLHIPSMLVYLHAHESLYSGGALNSFSFTAQSRAWNFLGGQIDLQLSSIASIPSYLPTISRFHFNVLDFQSKTRISFLANSLKNLCFFPCISRYLHTHSSSNQSVSAVFFSVSDSDGVSVIKSEVGLLQNLIFFGSLCRTLFRAWTRWLFVDRSARLL